MNIFRTIVALILMGFAGLVGLYAGSLLVNAVGGAILLSMIAGIACVVYALDNPNK